MQLTAAWVRRKRFEAGLLAQALLFGGFGRSPIKEAAPAGRDAFWNLLTSGPGVTVVNVGAGDVEAGNGDQTG